MKKMMITIINFFYYLNTYCPYWVETVGLGLFILFN